MVGGRKISHPDDNITALSLELSGEAIEKIEDAYHFDIVFPLKVLFMGQETPSRKGEDVWLTKMAMNIDTVERPRPIAPRFFEA